MAMWGERSSDRKRKKQVGEHHDGSFSVYMAHKIQKLRRQNASFTQASGSSSDVSQQQQRHESPAANSSSSSNVLEGVHVHVDGYTVPSKEEIRQLMLLHGGGFEHYETARVTHIIATHLPASKVLQLKKMRKPTPVVHPDWLVQSIEQRRLLPTKLFLYQGFADPSQNNILSLMASTSPFSLASPLLPGCVDTPVASSSSVERVPPTALVDLTCDSVAQARSAGRADQGESVRSSPAVGTAAELPVIQELSGDDDEEGERLSDADDELDASEESRQSTSTADTTAHTAVAVSLNLDPPAHAICSSDTRSKSTRDGPAFVRHFFAKSRLHHIGNWRSTFQQRAGEFLSIYKGPAIRREPPTSDRRVILHVDMDCFFVAVAVRGRAELQSVPVAVAHSGNSGGTSEISSCNYLARAKGVRAGLFMQAAKELCPELVVLPYKFEEIEQVSFQIYRIFFSHTPYVQAMSCDEALLEFGRATDGMAMAKRIREEIFEQSGCPASVGVSYNVLLAKLASKEAKPDGMFQIESPQRAEPFLLSLTVRDLPGVGRGMGAKLRGELGVEDMLQLRALTKSELVHHFGKTTGEMLFNFARGADCRPLSIESNMMRKSVSAVVNFGIRFEKWDDATAFMMALAEELRNRLQALKVRAECLTLLIKKRREGEPIEPWKYMGHGMCDNFSKSRVLAEPTDDDQVIGKACIALLRQLHIPTSDLRGVGIQASKLVGESSAATGGQTKTRQLFKSWLGEPAAASGERALLSVIIESKEDDTSTADERDPANERGAKTQPIRVIEPAAAAAAALREAQIGLSQVNMSVLDELPPWIRDEVLSTYRPRQSGHTTPSPPPPARQLGAARAPSMGSRGKKPLQKPARTRKLVNRLAASSSITSAYNQQQQLNQHAHSGAANALDDIRMSQIDSDVYYALPFTLRKEIARNAKKSKSSSSVVPVAASAAHRAIYKKPSAGYTEASKALQSIEELFQHLLEAARATAQLLDATVATTVVDTADHSFQDSQSEAFDSIYSRIMLEVENRALDHALRMLRYVRRKCESSAVAKDNDTLNSILRAGFNRVLDQVNSDIRQHFRGVLSSAAIAPL